MSRNDVIFSTSWTFFYTHRDDRDVLMQYPRWPLLVLYNYMYRLSQTPLFKNWDSSNITKQ